jgi:hypothetical protein
LKKQQPQEIADYAEASGNPRITHKITKLKSGIKLSHEQIHYIRKKVNKSELDGPGSSADKLLTDLCSRPDISLYCSVYDQCKTNLLATRNKGGWALKHFFGQQCYGVEIYDNEEVLVLLIYRTSRLLVSNRACKGSRRK